MDPLFRSPDPSFSSNPVEPTAGGGAIRTQHEEDGDDDPVAGGSMMVPAGAQNGLGLAPESVRAYADSVGIPGLSDEAAREVAEEVTFR